MKGIIQEDGMVLGEDKNLYEPDMIYKDTILLICTSCARMPIKDVVGKEVEFLLNKVSRGYNFKLI